MTSDQIELAPYQWAGPYAKWRDDGFAPHDPGLCAQARASWMAPDERMIIRSCEMIGYPEGFLYDDHYPPAEPDGRGRDYDHTSFQWNTQKAPQELSTDCTVKNKGHFSLSLRGEIDYIDIFMNVRNDMTLPLGPIDWAFCPIALECPSVRNPEHDHTFLYDGQRLRSIREIDGVDDRFIYAVAGGEGFRPEIHDTLTPGSIEAQESIIIMEGKNGHHTLALGFEQSHDCFSCRGNVCFHADPYFGILQPGEEKKMDGRLYLIEGNAEEVFARYRRDFRNLY